MQEGPLCQMNKKHLRLMNFKYIAPSQFLGCKTPNISNVLCIDVIIQDNLLTSFLSRHVRHCFVDMNMALILLTNQFVAPK